MKIHKPNAITIHDERTCRKTSKITKERSEDGEVKNVLGIENSREQKIIKLARNFNVIVYIL